MRNGSPTVQPTTWQELSASFAEACGASGLTDDEFASFVEEVREEVWQEQTQPLRLFEVPEAVLKLLEAQHIPYLVVPLPEPSDADQEVRNPGHQPTRCGLQLHRLGDRRDRYLVVADRESAAGPLAVGRAA